jgi:hypothetical protein
MLEVSGNRQQVSVLCDMQYMYIYSADVVMDAEAQSTIKTSSAVDVIDHRCH